MSNAGRFCSECGAGLLEGAPFCSNCGIPAVTMPVAPVHQTEGAVTSVMQPSGFECVHAIIPNTTLKAGFMGVSSKQYTLILTDRRVIFAQTTTAMMKQLVADARDGAKSGGKGFFGQWGAQLSAYSAFAERYLEMSPDQALAESADNFALDRSNIIKTSMKTGHIYGDDTVTTDRVVFKTTGKKYDVTLGYGAGQAREALTTARMI